MRLEYVPCFAVQLPYPGAFHPNVLEKVKKEMSGFTANICCGSAKEFDVTVDLDVTVRPNVVASATALPFRNGVFDSTACDPPYNDRKVKELYKVGKGTLVWQLIHRELERITKSIIIYLHYYIPHFKGFALSALYICDVGGTFRSRILSISNRQNERLDFT